MRDVIVTLLATVDDIILAMHMLFVYFNHIIILYYKAFWFQFSAILLFVVMT